MLEGWGSQPMELDLKPSWTAYQQKPSPAWLLLRRPLNNFEPQFPNLGKGREQKQSPPCVSTHTTGALLCSGRQSLRGRWDQLSPHDGCQLLCQCSSPLPLGGTTPKSPRGPTALEPSCQPGTHLFYTHRSLHPCPLSSFGPLQVLLFSSAKPTTCHQLPAAGRTQPETCTFDWGSYFQTFCSFLFHQICDLISWKPQEFNLLQR